MTRPQRSFHSKLKLRDDAIMLLVLRALLVLGLATLLNATRENQAVSMRFRQGTRLKGKTVRLVLDPSVQPQTNSVYSSNIANMSLSPWTYRDNCEANRLPSRISEAQCKTSGCLSPQDGVEDAGLEAKPIYYQVLVLHRVPKQRLNTKGGRKARKAYDFRLGTKMISVGCTCVRPSVLPQQ